MFRAQGVRAARIAALAAAAILVHPPAGWAQSSASDAGTGPDRAVRRPAAQRPPAGRTRGWEVEGLVGFFHPGRPARGSGFLPPAGPAIATTSPIFPSRHVPSWFFGDGASILNSVNAEFGVAPRVVPLDAALTAPRFEPDSTGMGGVRVRRGLTPRFSLEFSLDLLAGQGRVSEDLRQALETTRRTFQSAFAGLLATGPFTNVTVSATSSGVDGSNRELALTGALVWHLPAWGGVDPHVTVGGGVLTGAGDRPSATLDGHYRFSILGVVPIEERDHVALRYERSAAAVALAGAGFGRQFDNGWGLRLDGRVLVGRNGTRLRLDARPGFTTATPADFIESFTNPAIQFSNNPSTGRQSTLGGPHLESFTTFSGSGLETRVLITMGLVRRF